nr:succinate dehydrogenase 6 [Viscum album]
MGEGEDSRSSFRRSYDDYVQYLGKIWSAFHPYSRFKPLPSWTAADVEAFIASEPDVHGPAMVAAQKTVKFASTGCAIGAVSSAALSWRSTRSPQASLLSLGAGAVMGWLMGHEVANHWLQLYRMDTVGAHVKFLEWMQARSREENKS